MQMDYFRQGENLKDNAGESASKINDESRECLYFDLSSFCGT